jgi:hypothetical protein
VQACWTQTLPTQTAPGPQVGRLPVVPLVLPVLPLVPVPLEVEPVPVVPVTVAPVVPLAVAPVVAAAPEVATALVLDALIAPVLAAVVAPAPVVPLLPEQPISAATATNPKVFMFAIPPCDDWNVPVLESLPNHGAPEIPDCGANRRACIRFCPHLPTVLAVPSPDLVELLC